MAKVRDVFLGGNTCYGFYSFYDYIVSPDVIRKYVLKGGPGVGKSVLMKKIGAEFAARGYDIEYHWCSSDNNSLDGVVIGNNKICLVDGTAPHIIDPKFPAAVDQIINLGQFWHQESIMSSRGSIISLTSNISTCFERAYLRLREANCAYDELKSYYEEAGDVTAIKRNITALGEDFLQNATKMTGSIRHLFPGAITPEGLVTKLASIIDKNMSLFTVKGSPGSGVKSLFKHVVHLLEVNAINAEVYHNPFNPEEVDAILIPETKAVLIDLSDFFFDYSAEIPGNKYKRQLDFNKFIDDSILDTYAKNIDSAQNRIELGIKEAVSFITKAKGLHDELESYYTPAMDYEAIDSYRQELIAEITELL